MPGLAPTHRPPLVGALALILATIALRPEPATAVAPEPLGPREIIVVPGELRGDRFVPPTGFATTGSDPWLVQAPPEVFDRSYVNDLGDGFAVLLRVLTTPQTSGA